jgi:hypothetical protein
MIELFVSNQQLKKKKNVLVDWLSHPGYRGQMTIPLYSWLQKKREMKFDVM